MAENSKSAIETRQDQDSSGHRRMRLTIEIVMRIGATPGCSGCVGLGSHTESRVRSRRTSADERADPVETPIGPITEPATESQESAPAAQQEPTSSSFGPAAPMPTQNFQNELMDSPMEMGAQEHREQRIVRLNETLSSEMSRRQVVKAKSAHPPMIWPMMEDWDRLFSLTQHHPARTRRQ